MCVLCDRDCSRDDDDEDGPGDRCDNDSTWLFVVSIYGFLFGAGCVTYVISMTVVFGVSYFFT